MRDLRLSLSEEIYTVIAQRAMDEGFDSPEGYLVSLIEANLVSFAEGADHIFTPELLADLDAALAEAQRAGSGLTVQEARARYSEKSRTWRKSQAS